MFIAQIETCNPPPMPQADIMAMLGLTDSPFAQRVFAASAITSRCLVLDDAMARQPLAARVPALEDVQHGLACQAVDRLGLDPARVSAVVVSTFYNLATPTLAHRLVDAYLPDDTAKFHLVGAGCAGTIPALDLAWKCWQAQPHKEVLMVCADLASVFLAPPAEEERARIVGSSLFGDGLAAVRFGTRATTGPAPQLLGIRYKQFPDTMDRARFVVGDQGGYIAIDQQLPAIARDVVGDYVRAFLAGFDLSLADVHHWALHPGGRAILDSLQDTLALSDDQLAPARHVLAHYGNMSTPSALYVLDAIQDPAGVGNAVFPGEYGMMVTIGPGLTVGLALLRWN